MISLLKMDIRRIFKSKGIYVGAFCCLIVTLFFVSAIGLSQDSAKVGNLDKDGVQISSTMSNETAFQINAAESVHLIISSAGLFTLLLMILNSMFIGSDFDSGFVKNIFTYRAGRIQYLLSKWIVMQAISAIYLLLIMGSLDLYERSGVVKLSAVSAQEVMTMFLFGLLYSGVSLALSSTVAVLFRNKAVNIAASFILSCGWLVQAVSAVMGILKIDGTVGKRHILDYTIYGAKNSIVDFLNPKGAQFSILVLGVWLIIWLISSCIILKKRDI